MGISTTEGCATMVLSIFLCQQEATPRRKPGKNIMDRMVVINDRLSSSGGPTYQNWSSHQASWPPNGEAIASPFPTRVRRHAAYTSSHLEKRKNEDVQEFQQTDKIFNFETWVQGTHQDGRLLQRHDKGPPFKDLFLLINLTLHQI